MNFMYCLHQVLLQSVPAAFQQVLFHRLGRTCIHQHVLSLGVPGFFIGWLDGLGQSLQLCQGLSIGVFSPRGFTHFFS